MLPSTFYPFIAGFAVSLILSLVVDRWERWRLSRPGGPYAATDFIGPITLVAFAVALWQLFPQVPALRHVLLAASAVFLVAAVTDQWRPMRGLRFAATVIAALGLCLQDVCITSVKVPFSFSYLELAWLGPVVTVLWLGVSSALFARAGSLPRVSLGVATLASATLFAVCLLQPAVTGPAARNLTMALTGICLAMSLLPRHLTHGGASAGSYLLGFLIGTASIMGALKHTALLVALLPLMIIGVPLFGAAYSWIADLFKGRRQVPRRRHPHLHEILLAQGYSEKQVAAILLLATAVLCALALLLVALIRLSFVLKLLIVLLVVVGALMILYILLRLMKPANPPKHPDEVHLLGVRVHRVTMEEAMRRVEEFILQGSPHMIVTSDATGLMRAQDDLELRQIINAADLVTADGAGVILSARLLNMPLDVRVSGCDMVGEISRVAAKLDRSVYLFGAAPGVAEKAGEKLQEMAPGLQIAGCRDGFFTPADEPGIIAEIAAARPAALFVALGIPRQEKWIRTHMEELGVPVCIGIGGSFDVISGMKKRAPVWMQRTGLEWLYRVGKEPSRLPRLVALPRIVMMTFAELLRPPEETDE